MKTLMSFIKFLGVPLIVLNMLGGIISGIWLAILGEWATIAYGILILLVAPQLLSWSLLLPSAVFAWPMKYFSDKGKTFGTIATASLSSVYTMALMTIWCCGIFFLFMTRADASNLILHLVWSYGIAIGPWGYLASKEHDNFASAISTFLAELAYITLMLFVLFTTINLYDAIHIFAAFMVIAVALQIVMAVMIDNEQKKLPIQSVT
jgi:hypothetical protein